MRELKFRQWTTGWASGTDRMIYLGDMHDEDFTTCQDGVIMQYTGLHDKNGKEIYIGDVVSIEGETTEGFYRKDNYEVTINNFTQIPVIDSHRGQMELHKCFKVVEVIGNVYEMPDWDF